MKMKYFISFLLLLCVTVSQAQKWKSNKSHIKFFSDAVLEDIEAINEKGTSIVDLESGDIVFSIPIKQFQFDKSLMQEHFNENYLESDKYPKCTFSGKISSTQYEEGENKVTVSGTMNLHGVKQEMTVEGTMYKKGNWIKGRSKFMIKLEDYKIKIPRAVFQNIAEEIEVTVMFEYVPI